MTQRILWSKCKWLYSTPAMTINKRCCLLSKPVQIQFLLRPKSVAPEPPPVQPGMENWTAIYRFPYIRQATFMNRLKLYQTIFMSTCAPIGVVSYSLGYLSLLDATKFFGLSTFACLMLYVFGTLFSKLIGVIYVSKEGNIVRIAHMTFFGKRKDIEVPIKDIKVISETNYRYGDLYFPCARYSTNDILYFTIKFGGVLDSNHLTRIFGHQM